MSFTKMSKHISKIRHLLYASYIYTYMYNFRTNSQFPVKWVCRNKFIIIIIIIINAD